MTREEIIKMASSSGFGVGHAEAAILLFEQFANLVLEKAAESCFKQQDLVELERASKRFKESQKNESVEFQIARGEHWMTVNTCNAVARNCAKAILDMRVN